jgi:hypothetical protein
VAKKMKNLEKFKNIQSNNFEEFALNKETFVSINGGQVKEAMKPIDSWRYNDVTDKMKHDSSAGGGFVWNDTGIELNEIELATIKYL